MKIGSVRLETLARHSRESGGASSSDFVQGLSRRMHSEVSIIGPTLHGLSHTTSLISG